MSAATKLELVISELVLAVCAGLLPALLLGLYGLVEGTEPSRERFVAVAATGLVVATSAWLVHLTRRIRGSRRRMGDPMYRAKLIEFVMSAGADRGRGAVGRSD